MKFSESQKNSMLLLISILIFIVIAEAGLRVFTNFNLFVDRRADYFWINSFGNFDKDVDSGKDGDTVQDDMLGWRMRPMLVRDGVNHNSIGFRGRLEHAEISIGPRIVTIGDSFTYGLGVRDEETFSSHLGRLTDSEVINAGVNAYGVDQAFLMWESDGQRFKPDVVVLGYYVDDFYRNLLAVRDRLKPRFVFNSTTRQFEQHSVAGSKEFIVNVAQRRNWIETWRVHHAVSWLWRKSRYKLGLIGDEEMMRGARLSEFLLKRLRDAVNRSDARLLVAFIGDQYGGGADHAWIEDSVMQSCRSLNIECVNLAAATRSADSSQFYGSNRHYSPFGHRFAAEQIARALGPIRQRAQP